MDAREAVAHRVALAADVVGEHPHRPQPVRRGREQVAEALVELDVHVEVALHELEAPRLVPGASRGVVARPRLEARESVLAGADLCFRRSADATPRR